MLAKIIDNFSTNSTHVFTFNFTYSVTLTSNPYALTALILFENFLKHITQSEGLAVISELFSSLILSEPSSYTLSSDPFQIFLVNTPPFNFLELLNWKKKFQQNKMSLYYPIRGV